MLTALGSVSRFEFRQHFVDKISIIGWFQRNAGLIAAGEFKDVANHVVDANSLFADARGLKRPFFRRGFRPAHDLGGKTDDGQRIFKVVDDGTSEIANGSEAFGLEDFAQMELVKFAQALADFLQHVEREARRVLQQRAHFVVRNEINFRVSGGDGSGRTRQAFNYRHFTKNFPRTELRKDMANFLARQMHNFDQALFDDINAVAHVAFAQNLRAKGELPFASNTTQTLQFIRA